jgi:hypothetical protein
VDYGAWRAAVHPDDLAGVEAALQRCTDPQGDGVYDIEYRVLGNDGRGRWIATRGQTQFENCKPVWFYGVALDVTDRKRIENALERRVEARTRELEEANKELRSQITQREIAETRSNSGALPHAYPPHNGSLLELTGTDPAIICGQHCQRHKSPSSSVKRPTQQSRSLMSLRWCESPSNAARIAALLADQAPPAIIGCPHHHIRVPATGQRLARAHSQVYAVM